jgi:hypothetical protein
LGDNSVPISINRKAGLNAFILTLEGANGKYSPMKLFMDK